MHPVRRAVRRLLVSWAPGLLVLLAVASAGAQGDERRAGLVVQYGDGTVETACVSFAEPDLSGVELLERAGLDVVSQSSGMGAAVCKLGPDGCDYPAEGCFCEREGSRSIYWAFYTLDEGAWAYAPVGAASAAVSDGDVHGWAWGLGESGAGATPPVVDFATICGPVGDGAPATASPASAGTTAAPAAASSPDAAAAPPEASEPESTAAPRAEGEPVPAAPSQAEGAPWAYAGFGALVLILGAGAAILARRR